MLYINVHELIYVTGFMKTDPNHTRTEIFSLPKNTLILPRCTKHMAKDGQVCFYRRLFADPVNPQRCTTEPVKPLHGTNKDVSCAKLLLMTTSVYLVNRACSCPLLKTQHHCLCPNRSCNPPLASQTPLPLTPTHSFIHTTCDITVTVLKNQQ